MARIILTAAFALAGILPLGAQAQVTRTTTTDRPNYEVNRTLTRDPATGTASRDTQVVRKSDGAVATSSVNRSRSADGRSYSASQTGFGGRTRSVDYDRTRTENGYTASGSATGRGGRTVNYAADRNRTGTGFTANRSLTGGNGRTLYSNQRSFSRDNGQIMRSSSTTRAAGFGRRMRGRH